ncbi:MAG: hypothetical protein ABSB30_07880 [Terracidiphilus sp.]
MRRRLGKLRTLTISLMAKGNQRVLLAAALVAFSLLGLAAPFGLWPLSAVPADFRMPLLGFFANLCLVAVTWSYVLITRRQLIELQSAREPNAALNIRIPQPESEDINYGRGNNQYRKGPPIFLDVWNVGGPTIMVTRITVAAEGSTREGLLTPQALIESGKVAPINVAYDIIRLINKSRPYLDLPDDYTHARAHFTVEFFSKGGTRSVQTQGDVWFFVSEEYVNITTDDPFSQQLALEKMIEERGGTADRKGS